MNNHIKKGYLLYVTILQGVSITLLLFLYACDCTNSNQIQPHRDELPMNIIEIIDNIRIQVTPTRLRGDDQDFSLEIKNIGIKDISGNQLKLIITRIIGNDASIGLDGQSSQLQEIWLEELEASSSMTKKFRIYPNTDTRASFSFQLLYMGKRKGPSVTVSWQESWLEISQLYYCREGNQVYYQISNHGSLQKDDVKLVYRNLTNNKVTLAGFTEQSIVLGNLGSLTHPYSGLQINFNGETTAEFEFKLIEKNNVIETRTISLKHIKLRLEGIKDGGVFYGKKQLRFSIKNRGDVPVNIENIYIHCTNDNGVDFQWLNNDDVSTAINLASYAGKDILAVEEEISLSMQLKESYNHTRSNLMLEIHEHCDNQRSKIAEMSLNWLEG